MKWNDCIGSVRFTFGWTTYLMCRRLHIEYFPRGHHLGTADMDELIGILIHAVTGKTKDLRSDFRFTEPPDQLTSPYSTILYSVDTLGKMLNVAKEFKGKEVRGDSRRSLPYSAHLEFGSSDETVCMHGEFMSTTRQ